MAEASRIWRPNSAWSCDLRDRELAGIGLLTQYEVQIYSSLSLALKALERLDLQQWRNLDKTPLEQIAKRVADAAEGIDEQLSTLVGEFESKRHSTLQLRHKIVHSQWGFDPNVGSAIGIYRKTHEKLGVEDITHALELMAPLTFEAKAIAYRCAELIAEGVLKSGNSKKAPRMSLEGTLIQF